MQFLTKLYFFNAVPSGTKVELYISSSSINVMTWNSLNGVEGTIVHTIFVEGVNKINHLIDGNPDNVNNIAFDGLFFKCTSHYVGTEGTMKSFSAWINPDNIRSMQSLMPDDTKIFFNSGKTIVIKGNLQDIKKALLDHCKKTAERKKVKFGKKPT
jgi:uncharacterized protein YlzI (FlbEa/FlbD family)